MGAILGSILVISVCIFAGIYFSIQDYKERKTEEVD